MSKKQELLFEELEAVWVDPNEYKKSRLNIAPSLDHEKYQSLKSQIQQDGQKDPGAIWRGEVVAGWHRNQIARDLERRWKAIVIPDYFTEDQVKRIIDRELFSGRELTVEQKAAYLWSRHKSVINQLKRGGAIENRQIKLPDGSLVTNGYAYLKEQTQISVRTLHRLVKVCHILFMQEPIRARARVDILEEYRVQAKRDGMEYRKRLARKSELQKEIEKLDKELKEIKDKIMSCLTPDSKGSREKKFETALRILEKK